MPFFLSGALSFSFTHLGILPLPYSKNYYIFHYNRQPAGHVASAECYYLDKEFLHIVQFMGKFTKTNSDNVCLRHFANSKSTFTVIF